MVTNRRESLATTTYLPYLSIYLSQKDSPRKYKGLLQSFLTPLAVWLPSLSYHPHFTEPFITLDFWDTCLISFFSTTYKNDFGLHVLPISPILAYIPDAHL